MAKQFYISMRIGNLDVNTVIGTPKFEYCVENYVLNTSLLTDDELEQFEGILTVLGLHQYFVASRQSYVVVKYGNVDGCLRL